MRDNRLASVLLLSTREGYPRDVSMLAARHWRAVNGDELPAGVDHVMTAFSLRFGAPEAIQGLPLDHKRDPIATIFALTREQLRRSRLWIRVPRHDQALVIEAVLDGEIEGLRLHEHVAGWGRASRAVARELLRWDFTLARKQRRAGLRNFLLEREE